MGLKVMEHKDGSGKSATFTSSKGNMPKTGGPGKNGTWNDEISSLEVTDIKESWIVFQDDNFKGEAFGPFTMGGRYETTTFFPNDYISSVKKFVSTGDETMAERHVRLRKWIEDQGKDLLGAGEKPSGDDEGGIDWTSPATALGLPVPDLKLPKFPDIKLFDIFDPEKRKEFWEGVLDYFWQSPNDVDTLMDAFNFPIGILIGWSPITGKLGVAFPFSLAFLFRNKMRAAQEAGKNARQFIIPFIISVLFIILIISFVIWFMIRYKPLRRLLKWAWAKGKKVGDRRSPETIKTTEKIAAGQIGE